MTSARVITEFHAENQGVQAGVIHGNVTNSVHNHGEQIPSNPSTIPRAPHPLYIGRAEIAARLADAFKPRSPASLQVFVITGLGGAGKSEVCLKFAADHKQEFWGVFWMDCSSIASIEQGYRTIGQLCNLKDYDSGTVKAWLASCNKRWLLIADNADDPGVDFSDHLPHGDCGSIVMTTRNPDCNIHQTVGSETLYFLSPDHARKLLFQAAGVSSHEWDSLEMAAMEVLEVLGFHTLAIIQAGAYIKKDLCRLEEYIELFEEAKEELLKFSTVQKQSRYNSVFATFEVSAKQLQKLQDDGDRSAEDALQLLHTFAFLHHTGVQEEIMLRASRKASDILDGSRGSHFLNDLNTWHAARILGCAPQDWLGPRGYTRWRRACNLLSSFSLITKAGSGSGGYLSMHPLVHAWASERQDWDAQNSSWISAISTIALNQLGLHTYVPVIDCLLPHISACLSLPVQDRIEEEMKGNVAQVFFLFARALYIMDSDVDEVDRLIEWISKELQLRNDGSTRNDLKMNRFKAQHLMDQGRQAEAIEILERVIDIEEWTHKKDLNRTFSQNVLARAYSSNGQISEAIGLLEHVVDVQGRELPENDPRRLAAVHDLAVNCRENKNLDRAIQLLEYVVSIDGDIVPEDHPSLLTSQYELAEAYFQAGQVDQAIELGERVVKIMGTKLEEDDSDLLRSQQHLATYYNSAGRLEEAIEILERVVEIGEAKIAEGDPDLLTWQHDLATYYKSTRRLDEAIGLLEHVVQTREMKLARDDPDLLRSQRHLATYYNSAGRLDEAIEILEHVVNIREAGLATDDPVLLRSQYNLALYYDGSGRLNEAVSLMEHVVAVRNGNLPEDHPSRLRSQTALVRLYQQRAESSNPAPSEGPDSALFADLEVSEGKGDQAQRAQSEGPKRPRTVVAKRV